ncbi:hypothetical protein ACQ4PT_044460 [Festuca glaucescens]
MEVKYRSLFRDVSPCVVLVEQVGRIDYFCIGSVISQGEKTVILTQSKICNKSVSLSVRFFDGRKQEAAVLLEKENLCVLITNLYPKCKKVEFFEGIIDHVYAAAIAPASKSSVYNIPGFIIQKSVDMGSQAEAGSSSSCSSTKHQFTFSCLYGDKGANKVSRLICGPVFNMDGKVVGIVIDDMQYEAKHEKLKGYAEMGYELKMCVSGGHLQSILRSLFKDNDWQAGIQKAITKVTEVYSM